MKKGLSDALFLTDTSDYILPSQSCIVQIKKKEENKRVKEESISSYRIEKDEESGKFFQVFGGTFSNSVRKEELKEVNTEITLADCLTCSGCTTTAESILVNSQTVEKFIKFCKENNEQEEKKKKKKKKIIISVSHESLLSIRYFYGFSSTSETFQHICLFFNQKMGIKTVIHLNHEVYVENLTEEFIESLKSMDPSSTSLPLLMTSHCPGFVCFAEKTHGDFLLDYLSKVPSSLSIFGEYIKKKQFSSSSLDDIYHVSIAPCYDKKLEICREEFESFTDLVITTTEFIEMMKDHFHINDLKEDIKTEKEDNTESFYGGDHHSFSECVIQKTAKSLWNEDLPISKIEFKRGRNSDFQMFNLPIRNNDTEESFLQRKGIKSLKFLRVNGFRNIQTILRRIESRKCPYHFIEVNACPKGCLFGGGQLRMKEEVEEEEGKDKKNKKKNSNSIQEFTRELIELSKEGQQQHQQQESNEMNRNMKEWKKYRTVFHNRKETEEENKEESSASVPSSIDLDW